MANFRVCVIGGWCGNRMYMVAENLDSLLKQEGYRCRVTPHSVWDNYTHPPDADLILQLLPAFTQAETGCPVMTVKPFLVDVNHPDTIAKVLDLVSKIYHD